jgi:uncharacterized hydantoinase/oxoprolinase family protein
MLACSITATSNVIAIPSVANFMLLDISSTKDDALQWINGASETDLIIFKRSFLLEGSGLRCQIYFNGKIYAAL